MVILTILVRRSHTGEDNLYPKLKRVIPHIGSIWRVAL